MGVPFIKVSVIYDVIGIALGIYKSLADAFRFASAHAHIHLLGWASMAIAGVIDSVFAAAGKRKLARTHVGLTMIGAPLLFLGMILFGVGRFKLAEPVSGAGGTIVFIAVLLFFINVMKNVKEKARFS